MFWLSFRELSLFLLTWGHRDRNRWKSNYLVRDRKHSEEAIERGQGPQGQVPSDQLLTVSRKIPKPLVLLQF